MDSMNNFGNRTHLAGTLANAKPWMSVSCWPGYIAHRSNTVRDSQPKVEMWANTEQGVVPSMRVSQHPELKATSSKKQQVNHTS